MFSGCYLASTPLPGAGGGDDDGDTLVTFDTNNLPSANGSATTTTTEITFTLSEAIPGLTADDITLSGVAGVTKGTLSGSGPTYTLPISGFTAGGELTITVSKTGYTISGSQTVTIYYYSGAPHTHTYSATWSFDATQHWHECTAGDGAKDSDSIANHTGNPCTVCGYDSSEPSVTFSTLTADGSATATTTTLTLTFDAAITGLSASDITLSGVAGVSKGILSGAGPTYTLPISGFTTGGTLSAAVAKTGYNISGSPKTVAIYYGYSLGDTGPGGGKIFYVSATGFYMTDNSQLCYYLEAAPDDMGTKLAWASSAFIPPAQGGTGNWVSITGTTQAIGAGRNNTALILATDAAAPAAKACNDYSNNGKNDWFLPSELELNQLYVNRTSVGNMEVYPYWSSSQVTNNTANSIQSNGAQPGDGKYNIYSVRAVRAF